MRVSLCLLLLVAGCNGAAPQSATLEVYLRSDLSLAELSGATIETTATTPAGAPNPVSIRAADIALSRLQSP